MPGIYQPGTQQAAGDAVTWVFKDGGEPMQLTFTLVLGGLALYAWYKANKQDNDEQDLG